MTSHSRPALPTSRAGAAACRSIPLIAAAALLAALVPTSGLAQGNRGGSPAEMLRRSIEMRDPISFLLDKRKELSLDDTQTDSLKALRGALREQNQPLIKEMVQHLPKEPARPAGGMPMGDGGGPPMGGRGGGGGPPMGGRMGGGGGRGGRDGAGPPGGMPTLPDTVQALMKQVEANQQVIREHGRALLTEEQRQRADVLERERMEEQRRRAPGADRDG